MTPGIRRTRSVPQGDPCAADLFGEALDIPATAFCERCQTEKWGAPIITVSDTVITRRSREQGFKARGAWITFDGHFLKEIAERAWRRFYAIRHLLCDNKVALRQSLRLLSSCVASSMYWCSGSWILTQSQCTHLRAIQDKMLRRMVFVPRLPTETAEAHMTRWSKLLHNCRAKHKILHRDEVYFASCFSWCGHVARVTTMDPQRETSPTFTLKNMEWLRNLKKELGSQCHGRRFRVWRWKQAVAQCVATEWVKVALYRAAWRAKMDAMGKWRKQKMANRKCRYDCPLTASCLKQQHDVCAST